MSISEAVKNGMRALDARQVGIGVAAASDHCAGQMDAEDVGQAEICAALISLGVHAGFKRGQQRAALVDVVAQLLALRVAEQRGIGQDESGIFLDPLQMQAILVHEVEEKAPFEQRVVHRIHVLLHGYVVRRLIEKLRALAHDDADVGDRAFIHRMRIVASRPLKVIAADLLPAQIFAQAFLSAHDVIVGNHAAGESFAEPHHAFRRRLSHLAPADRAGRICSRHVGGHLAVEHGIAHPPLLRGAPDGRILPAAALVIGLEPRADLHPIARDSCWCGLRRPYC